MDICVAVVTHMENIVSCQRSTVAQNARAIKVKCAEGFTKVPFSLQVCQFQTLKMLQLCLEIIIHANRVFSKT